jgi:hypothetical protein
MKKPAGAKAAAGAVSSIIYERLFTLCSPTDQARLRCAAWLNVDPS